MNLDNVARAVAERAVDELRKQGIEIDVEAITKKSGAIDIKKLQQVAAILSRPGGGVGANQRPA